MNPELPAHHVSPSMKIVMLVFALVLIATLGWFVWDNNMTADTTDNTAPSVKKEAATETTTTADETADWKTYTNAELGLTLMYPNGYEVLESGDKYKLIKSKTNIQDTISVFFEEDKIDEFAQLSFLDSAAKHAVDGCAADGPNGTIYCKENPEKREITLDGGVKGYVFTLTEVSEVSGKVKSTTKRQTVALDVSSKSKNGIRIITFQRPAEFSDSLAEKIAKTVKF